MRCLLFFAALPLVLSAQSAESDQRITQTLISEIQQLRLAIERSTLLGARTQLATSQLQLQEAAVARLTSQYNDVRAQGVDRHPTKVAETIKDLEEKRDRGEFTTPRMRQDSEEMIRHLKDELERATAVEQFRAARESELALQIQAAQNAVTDSRARIAEMERALDAALQQLLKQK